MGSTLDLGSPQPFTDDKAEVRDPKQLVVAEETTSCKRGIKLGVPKLWLLWLYYKRGTRWSRTRGVSLEVDSDISDHHIFHRHKVSNW